MTLCAGKSPLLLDSNEGSIGWIFVAEEQIIVGEDELTVFVAYQPFVEFYVAVYALPYPDILSIVEIYYEFSNLVCFLIEIAEHYEGRVDQTITIYHIFFAIMHHWLIYLRFADLTAEIVLEVLIAIGSSGSWSWWDPVFETIVVAEFDWAWAFTDA